MSTYEGDYYKFELLICLANQITILLKLLIGNLFKATKSNDYYLINDTNDSIFYLQSPIIIIQKQ